MKRIVNILLLLCLTLCTHGENVGTERRQLMNNAWRFTLSDNAGYAQTDYDDTSWRTLSLPHDWSIEHPFNEKATSGNDGGYVETGTAWYRKAIRVPLSARGKQLKLYFEGVYMNAEVYVNGQRAGAHPYGYASFTVDITPYVVYDKDNIVAVRVDNSHQKNCRWYSGSGIYRNVWLLMEPEIHIKQWGTFITTPEVTDDNAKVKMEIEVENSGTVAHQVHVAATVTGHGMTGRSMTETPQAVDIAPGETRKVQLWVDVTTPALWSPDTPNLYTARLQLTENGSVVDRTEEEFGIRTFICDAVNGLMLNGITLNLNGGCVHHDNGLLGAKAFDAAEAWKVKQLKNAGFNAVRTSHNAPSEAFLRECDRQGLLVIDEAFDGWRDKKTDNDYHTLIDEWWQRDLEALVLRDRNHPSVFCWSIGNEVIERKRLEVVTTARRMVAHIKAMDDTRPVTSALAAWDDDWEIYDPLAETHDIVGYNYMIHKAESDHERDPYRVMIQTESYPRDAFRNWLMLTNHRYIVGDFVWTAMDYLGESGIGRWYYEGETPGEHWQNAQWPWHGAYCGDIDLTGWRKPISHYRNLLHNDTELLYLAVREPSAWQGEIKETLWSVWPTWESWNWPGWEGQTIEVEVYSALPKVRLYLNDKLIGEQPTTRAEELKTIFSLPYQPGTLRVDALDEHGNVLISKTLSTAGAPHHVRLTADKKAMSADGQDLTYVLAEVVDSKGNVVPVADNDLTFTVNGCGQLEGAGNADLKSMAMYTQGKHNAWKGRAMAIVRSNQKKGKAVLNVTSKTVKGARIEIVCK